MSWDNSAPAGSSDWTGGDSGATGWKDSATRAVATDDIVSGASTDNGFGSAAAANDGFGGDGGDGGGAGGACCNCGQEGHFARECTEPKKMGACFNCGEEGHSKVDCPNPRVFKGKCMTCDKEGHRADDCPDKPPPICKNCKVEGHEAKDCKDNRVFNLNHVADKTPDEGLAMLSAASNDRDIGDFKDAFAIYSKACPNMTYEDAERTLRKMEFKIYLIALTKEVGDTYTTVDLQGRIDREFTVGYYTSPKVQRPNLKERWPASPEENLERLKNAGVPLDRGVPKCARCEEMGHMARNCPQEDTRDAADRVGVSCYNCGEANHRVRDCPNERTFGKPRAPRECKICQGTDHIAKDCTERPVMTCRNCNGEGHKAADCTEPRAERDPATIQCRNCDEFGHVSRECPKPRDYTRVKCTNCGEMGHTKVRCKQPIAEDENAEAAGFENAGTSAGVEDPAPRTTDGGVDNWAAAPAASVPVAAGGGW